jgi:hypothetical protein
VPIGIAFPAASPTACTVPIVSQFVVRDSTSLEHLPGATTEPAFSPRLWRPRLLARKLRAPVEAGIPRHFKKHAISNSISVGMFSIFNRNCKTLLPHAQQADTANATRTSQE